MNNPVASFAALAVVAALLLGACESQERVPTAKAPVSAATVEPPKMTDEEMCLHPEAIRETPTSERCSATNGAGGRIAYSSENLSCAACLSIGVKAELKDDDERARRYYRIACKRGNCEGCVGEGQLLSPAQRYDPSASKAEWVRQEKEGYEAMRAYYEPLCGAPGGLCRGYSQCVANLAAVLHYFPDQEGRMKVLEELVVKLEAKEQAQAADFQREDTRRRMEMLTESARVAPPPPSRSASDRREEEATERSGPSVSEAIQQGLSQAQTDLQRSAEERQRIIDGASTRPAAGARSSSPAGSSCLGQSADCAEGGTSCCAPMACGCAHGYCRCGVTPSQTKEDDKKCCAVDWCREQWTKGFALCEQKFPGAQPGPKFDPSQINPRNACLDANNDKQQRCISCCGQPAAKCGGATYCWGG